MVHPDDISARMPAPRDDEPHELRRDIADELADHLQCSMTRERFRGEGSSAQSEEEIAQAAIARFGDPGQVARRLWWDAMKEKVMTQRLMMAVTLVAAAAAILAMLFLAKLVASNRAAQEQLLAAQQEWMQEMLAEMRSSGDSSKGADPLNQWQALNVRLVDEAGQPVTGEVYCSQSGEAGVNQQLSTDAEGTVDFGHLPNGPYTITAHVALTGETGGSQKILLGPGRPTQYCIKCPNDKPELITPRFALDVPAEFAKRSLYFVAQMSRFGRKFQGQVWTPVDNRELRYLLLRENGELLGELPIEVIEERGGSGGVTWISTKSDFVPADDVNAKPLLPVGEYQISVGVYASRAPRNEGEPNSLTMACTEFLRKNCGVYTTDAPIQIDSGGPLFWQGVRQQLSQLKASQLPAPAPAYDPYPAYQTPPASFSTTAPNGMYIAAQPTERETAPVRLVIETPDRLKEKPLYYLICFVPNREQPAYAQPTSVARFLFVDGKGTVLGEVPQKGPGWEAFLPVTSASDMQIKFPPKVLQRLPLLAHNGLPPGEFDVIAVPYLAAQKEEVAGTRPTIEALNGSDVFLARAQITGEEGCTVKIGAEQTDFWRGIDEVLREWSLEDAAEAQDKPAPTRPTATPPDSSGPG